MDLDDAIKAHSAWKLKLSSYIRNPDKSLKPEDVCLDNKCDLGKWIYGEGKKFESLSEFSTLKVEHAKFHKCAAEVIKKADAGQSVSEEVQIGGSSEFSKASSAVVTAILLMKKKV